MNYIPLEYNASHSHRDMNTVHTVPLTQGPHWLPHPQFCTLQTCINPGLGIPVLIQSSQSMGSWRSQITQQSFRLENKHYQALPFRKK
jgi:hypothetical protein